MFIPNLKDGDQHKFIRQLKKYLNERVKRVRFASVDENDLPVRRGHLILLIDDETGEVFKKVFGTR